MKLIIVFIVACLILEATNEKHDYNTCDVFCHKINDIIGFKHDVIGLTHDRAIYKHETI
uniref:Uncharacterized protein n=1 Tax=Magallana gigas TaxID=29159 RepID=K1Q2Y4_MAGGI